MTATLRGTHGEIRFSVRTGEVSDMSDSEGNFSEFYGENPEHSPVLIDVLEWERHHGKRLEEVRAMTFWTLVIGWPMANMSHLHPTGEG